MGHLFKVSSPPLFGSASELRSHGRSCLGKLNQRNEWHKYQWDPAGRRDGIRSSMRINMANKKTLQEYDTKL